MSDTLRNLPPVAPPAEPKRPPTLDELRAQATKDLGGERLTKWLFLRAKAAGRRAVAESRLKRLEAEDYMVRAQASTMHSDAAAQLVMANGVAAYQWQKAEAELSDAVEQVEAAESVIEALSRTPVVPIRAAQPQPTAAKEQTR